MPRNEDGEMELVLGNRQLLSVLFILVVLMGVFFTMGYIVGRNNPSEDKLRIAGKQQAEVLNKLPPTTVDPPSGGAKPSPASVEPAKPEPPPVETAKPEPPKPEPAKKEEAKKKEEPRKKEETAKQKKQPEPAPPPVQPSGTLLQTAPAAGMYLQVSATDKPGATGMAEAYRRQGFPVIITPSSSPTLFRVLVGPLANNQQVADMKTKLKGIGVDGTILRKF